MWALVRANLSFRLQTELALHHSSYPINKLISIHASTILATLEPTLEILILELVDSEPETSALRPDAAEVAEHYNCKDFDT